MSSPLIYPSNNTKILHNPVFVPTRLDTRKRCLVSKEKLSDFITKESFVEAGYGDNLENSCIICVGSTGAGKSSTVTKYTGVVTRSGSGTERVTRHCHLIRDIQEDSAPVWVDTVGWDDAECDDEETFKDILRFIDQYDITRVAAIIWNIVPNVRRDALLRKQAHLINQFKDEEIWRNVLIVAKQSLNPEADCAGAVRAAEEYSNEWPVLFTGYRFLTDPTVSPEQRGMLRDEATRLLFNIKSDKEVRNTLHENINKMGPPVQVVFNTSKCLDCSVVGDSRLLSKYCHMEPHLIHPGVVDCHHPGHIQNYHPTEHHVLEHEGRLKRSWYSNFLCGTLRKPRYSCCRRREGKEGCHKIWACCRQDWWEGREGCSRRWTCCGASPSLSPSGCSPRYSCCRAKVNDAGCKKVCKKCGVAWGQPAGTCFVRSHNLVNIEDVVADDNDEVLDETDENSVFLPKTKLSKPIEKKRIRKVTDILEKYPPIITYHIF